MWSLGCVAAELFLGWPLYPGPSEYDQVILLLPLTEHESSSYCQEQGFLDPPLPSAGPM